MPITYTDTGDYTTSVGTTLSANLNYKQVTVTVNDGDLIVASGASANAGGAVADAITTQAGPGTTSAWTIGYQNDASSSPGFIMGHAVCTAAGSITVRIAVGNNSNNMLMGGAVWVIPAAEWTGTPTYTTMPWSDADAKISVTLTPTSSTVIYSGVDWSGTGAPGTTMTPTGNVNDNVYNSTGNYAGANVHWTGQASGTRTYGPSSPAGDQWAGAVIEIEEPASGPQPEAIPVSFVAVGAYSTSGSTAPLSVPVPAGLQENDLAVCVITSKAASTTTISSSGWVQAYQSAVLGGGTVGTGTGPVYVTVLTRVVPAGGLSGPVSFSFNATPNSYVGVMFGLRYDATGYTSPSWNASSLTGTSYSRTTASTTFGGTGATDIGLAALDWLLFVSASADDQSSNHSSSGVPTLSATGTTLTGTTTRGGTGVTTTGGDCSQWVGTASVNTGASTDAPVMANLTANSSETGGGVFVKIRATGLPAAQPVTSTRQTSWAVVGQVTDTQATSWTTRASVTPSTRATAWTVSTAVTPSTRATTWRTLQAVLSTRQTTWGLGGFVISSRATTFAVLQSVSASRATTFATKASVTPSTRATTWRTLASVTPSTRATTWATRASVPSTRATAWTALASVLSTRATLWAVLEAAGQATSTRSTVWSVYGSVTPSTRATAWTVRTIVSATRGTSWRTLASTAPSTRATAWSVGGRATSTRSTVWSAYASVIPSVRATAWNTFASRTQTRGTAWETLASTAASRATAWSALASVGSTRPTAWTVSTSVASTRSTLWAVAAAAFGPGGLRRGLLHREAQTRTLARVVRAGLLQRGGPHA